MKALRAKQIRADRESVVLASFKSDPQITQIFQWLLTGAGEGIPVVDWRYAPKSSVTQKARYRSLKNLRNLWIAFEAGQNHCLSVRPDLLRPKDLHLKG
jgi:hypothetical protein